MEVVRARVTFPYKVGHFFKSAGPLRADLVKFRSGSRDFPCGGAAGRQVPAGPAPLGAPGVPGGASTRVAAVGRGDLWGIDA
jgi:hypothetical protein